MAQSTGKRILVYIVQWFIRAALAAGFLSAVADRFGLWGAPGAANVAWGNWQNFLEYVATLNWFVPAALIPALAWMATLAEIIIGLGLLVGWRLRSFSVAAGLLLLTFALAMTFSTGLKTALDASVFAASAGAFLLAVTARSDSSTKPVSGKYSDELKRT